MENNVHTLKFVINEVIIFEHFKLHFLTFNLIKQRI